MMTPPAEGRDLINLVAGESVSNVCVISGRVSEYGPKLRYVESGNPELPMTILVDGVGPKCIGSKPRHDLRYMGVQCSRPYLADISSTSHQAVQGQDDACEE
jgi:hypothetical protein